MSWFLVEEEAGWYLHHQDVTVVVYQQDQVLWQGQVAEAAMVWIRLYMGYKISTLRNVKSFFLNFKLNISNTEEKT